MKFFASLRRHPPSNRRLNLTGLAVVCMTLLAAGLTIWDLRQEAIKIWDLHSHEEVATLAGQGSFFVDAAFSPDGNTIGARNWSGVLHFWTAPSWQQTEAAEKGRGANSP